MPGELHEAITAANAAAAQATLDDLTAFDSTVTAGVSANFCLALSVLAGRQLEQAFDISFRSKSPGCAPGFRRAPFTSATVPDKPSGALPSACARSASPAPPRWLLSFVESLHDQPETADRWRVKVRGNLTMRGGTAFGRTISVRLDGQASYDRAMTAHQAQHLVRVRGDLSVHGRVELVSDSARFEVIG